MDKEKISVWVDDRPVEIYRGMTVKHALLALDQNLYEAARKGEILVRDDQGFTVGLEGALRDGARLQAKKSERLERVQKIKASRPQNKQEGNENRSIKKGGEP